MDLQKGHFVTTNQPIVTWVKNTQICSLFVAVLVSSSFSQTHLFYNSIAIQHVCMFTEGLRCSKVKKKSITWSERSLSSPIPSSVHFSFSANTPLLAPLLLYIPKSETYGQSTRLCTIFYFFDHPQGNVSRFIWLIAYKSKNNLWGHLVCSYHTVLSHCEQHEKQTDRNKDVIELNFNRNWFNVHIKLFGWQKGTIFCLWLLRINSQLDFKALFFMIYSLEIWKLH